MINKDTAYKTISELVDRFTDQYDSYKKSDYNETLTRRDFIDPFFKALGWDIDNSEGYAESYREVIHEDKIKVSGATKAPDYSFRLVGGKRLFFVEAKKPSVVVKDDIVPAYQIRRYGWSAKLPISIVTDFEEFAIYDCTKKPNSTDKASTARIKYFTFRDYLKEFDFLWETFSKERVLRGSFDKFVQSDTYKKGTATVDKEFLQSLDSWRTYLATSIAINNKQLDEDEINFVVQQAIDRIIFLRIAEDRGVEPYGNLKDAIKHGDNYKNLFEQFRRADEKYNSGLFDFKKDRISEHLKIENKIIKTIITDLYYPCPFAFNVMPVEILGTAYEQFLGKVIRITPAHHAKIEEKPEVRKAGGVYYTPQYIVEYIVKNTVGKLIDGKTPKEISKIKIVDPACGSGSFLIGAYQYLLDFHKNYYSNNGKPSKGKKDNPLTPEGNLTTAEKKRILLNNIFGVDIDVNAVEVTKLSLFLKCMEGETSASIAHQLSIFHERVLPTLDENIKSGNSLIDTDFYDSQLDFGDEKKIKPFNWQKEFPKVFKDQTEEGYIFTPDDGMEEDQNLPMVKEPMQAYKKTNKGGFDVVIGNPPYVRMQTIDKNQTDYFKNKFKSAVYGNYDLYVLFIEKALSILNERGLYGMILPHKFFQAEYGQGIRTIIAEGKNVFQINDFTTNQVFENATTYTCLLFLSKKANSIFNYQKTELGNKVSDTLNSFNPEKISSKKLNGKWNFNSGAKEDIFNKLYQTNTKLKDISRKIFKGSSTGNDDIYLLNLISQKGKTATVYSTILNENLQIEFELLKPFIYGSDVRMFSIRKSDVYLLFPYEISDKATLLKSDKLNEKYPLAKKYFERVKSILLKRKLQFTSNDYFKFSAGRSLSEYNQKKILIPDMLVESRIGIDNKGEIFHGPAIHSVVLNEKYQYLELNYIAALLSSKLFWFFISNTSTALRGNAYRLTPDYINPYPIKIIDKGKREDIQNQNEIIKLIDQLLKLNEEKINTKLQTKINQLESKIDYCKSRINEIVYQLYGLTKEEIKIVEGK